MALEIEKAFCLCIDKREEHWEDLENQCILKGIPLEKFVVGDGEVLPKSEYDYIDDKDPKVDTWTYGHPDDGTWVNHYNAFICHQRIIQRAKDQRLENFLMLEDDAYFTDRYYKKCLQIECTDINRNQKNYILYKPALNIDKTIYDNLFGI